VGAEVNCSEYRDWAAADADGIRSRDAEAARLHAEGCAACRAERERQVVVRSLLRSRPLNLAAPPGLRTRVLATLDEAEDRAASRRWWRRLALGAGVAVAAAVVVALIFTPRDGSFAPLIHEYDLASRGALQITFRTDSPSALEQFYGEHAAEGFPKHVIDLSPAGFQLVGATLTDFPGRRARLSIYSDGRNLIVCDYQFAENFPMELSRTGKPLFFRRGGVNFCAHRIGEEVCVLATRMPMALFRQKVGGESGQG
jgi:hypothetical protein